MKCLSISVLLIATRVIVPFPCEDLAPSTPLSGSAWISAVSSPKREGVSQNARSPLEQTSYLRLASSALGHGVPAIDVVGRECYTQRNLAKKRRTR